MARGDRITLLRQRRQLRTFSLLFAFIFHLYLSIQHVQGVFQTSFSSSTRNRENNLILRNHRRSPSKHGFPPGKVTEFSLRTPSSQQDDKYYNGSLSRVHYGRGRTALSLESRGGGSGDGTSNQSLSSSSYYLLNSFSIWSRIVCFTGLWILLARQLLLPISNTLSSLDAAARVPKVASILLHKVILPLLSSACCSIQLFLNLFGMGCAGFNTQLGPLRPFFTSCLLTSTLLSASSSYKWILFTVMTWCVALMPEIIHYSNERLKTHHFSSSLTNNDDDVIVELDVPSMGCVACINKINSSLLPYLEESSDNGVNAPVTDASSWLLEATQDGTKRGGKVQLRIKSTTSKEQVKKITKKVMDEITNAGFPNTLSLSSKV